MNQRFTNHFYRPISFIIVICLFLSTSGVSLGYAHGSGTFNSSFSESILGAPIESEWNSFSWLEEDYSVFRIDDQGEMIGTYAEDSTGGRVEDRELEANLVYFSETMDVYRQTPQEIIAPTFDRLIVPGATLTNPTRRFVDMPFSDRDYFLYSPVFLDYEDNDSLKCTVKEKLLGTDDICAGALTSQYTRQRYYQEVILKSVLQELLIEVDPNTSDPVEIANEKERLERVSNFILRIEKLSEYESLAPENKDLLEFIKNYEANRTIESMNYQTLAQAFNICDLARIAMGIDNPLCAVAAAYMGYRDWDANVNAGAIFAMFEHLLAMDGAAQKMNDIYDFVHSLDADHTDPALIDAVDNAFDNFNELVDEEISAFERSLNDPANLENAAAWIGAFTFAVPSILVWLGVISAAAVPPVIVVGGIIFVAYQVSRPVLYELAAYNKAWYQTGIAIGLSVLISDNIPNPDQDLRYYLSLTNLAWYLRALYYDRIYWISSFSHDETDWPFNNGTIPTRSDVIEEADIGLYNSLFFVRYSARGLWVNPVERRTLFDKIVCKNDGLEHPSLSPSSTAYIGTQLNFSIDYCNFDSIAPDSIEIVIDSIPYPLSPEESDYLTGAKHSISLIGFELGVHDFYFTSDVGAQSYRYPASEALSFTVDTTNIQPAIELLSPNNDTAFRYYQIEWNDYDPDDNAFIHLGYDTDSSGCDGIEIQSYINEDWVTDAWIWRNIPDGGPFWVYASIEDDWHSPTCVYSPGTLSMEIASSSDNYILDHIEVDDSEDGDGDGAWESGELVELKAYITNNSSYELSDVFGVIDTESPFVTIVDSDSLIWGSLPGVTRSGTFDLYADPNFTGIVTFELENFYHSNGGPLLIDLEMFDVIVSTTGSEPNFIISDVEFDDSDLTEADNDGIPESGEEDIYVDIELTNTGNAIASNVEASITQQPAQLPDLWRTAGEDYPDIPAGGSASPSGIPFKINDIPVNFSGTLDQVLTVYYGPDQEFSQEVPFQITISPTAWVKVSPEYYSFGQVDPGTQVVVDYNIQNIGTATATISSASGSNPDLSFPIIPGTVAPGATESMQANFDTTGIDASVVRSFSLNSDAHQLSRDSAEISGTVHATSPASYQIILDQLLVDEPTHIGAGDTDGDGLKEIILGYVYGGADYSTVSVLEQTSPGSHTFSEVWSSGSTFSHEASNPGTMTVGDVNGDGKEDVVLVTSGPVSVTHKVYFMTTNGDNSLSIAEVETSSTYRYSSVAIGDSDGDGVKEILVDGYDAVDLISHVRVFESTGGSSFANRWTSSFISEPGDPADEARVCGIKVGNTDGDSYPEIIIGTVYGQVYIFESTGNNAYASSPRLAIQVDSGAGGSSSWCDVEVNDIDADLKPEIIYSNDGEDQLWIYESTANNTWGEVWNDVIYASADLQRLLSGDTDGDGLKEFIVTHHSPDGIKVYETFGDNDYGVIFETTNPSIVPEEVTGEDLQDVLEDPLPEILFASEYYGYWILGLSQSRDLLINDWDLQYDPPVPTESDLVDIQANVTNASSQELIDVEVDFYLGDPATSGVLLGSDTIPSIPSSGSGVAHRSEMFDTEGTYEVFALVDPADLINETTEDNNKASHSLVVVDDDTDTPIISLVAIEEYGGDGDGWIEDDEQIRVEWTASDSSGIADTGISTNCSMGLAISLGGDIYESVGGPCSVDVHLLEIQATDGDNSPLFTVESSSFEVFPHQPIILDVDPDDLATNVSIVSNVRIWFGSDMNAASITDSSIILEEVGGAEIDATVLWDSQALKATLIPDTPLLVETDYLVTILSGGLGVKDSLGNELDSDHIWGFTTRSNIPPATPSNPDPGDGSSDIPIDTLLAWSASDQDYQTLSFDVYFDTASPPTSLVCSGTTPTVCDPGLLAHGETYFWFIEAADGYAVSVGPTWSFTTEPPDVEPPTVIKVNTQPATPDNELTEGETTHLPIESLTFHFSETLDNPIGDSDAGDVTNPANYLLVTDGGDVLETISCSVGLAGNDIQILISDVVYSSTAITAALEFADHAFLDFGDYRLFACGSSTLRDESGNPLDGNIDGTGGDDFILNFTLVGQRMYLPLILNGYTPQIQPPLAPSDLNAISVSNSEIDLSWTDNSSDETAFRIERSPGGADTWAEIDTIGADSTAHGDSGLACNSAYDYRVRAYRSEEGQYSGYSNVATGTTQACDPPADPSVLNALSFSQSQIDLSWTDNSSDETAFHIERSSGFPDNWVEIDTVGSDVTVYSDSSLTCSTFYNYRVRAYRSGDGQYSGYSDVASNTTQVCDIIAPTDLEASTVSQSQIDLSWTDNSSDETAFHIERSPGGADTWAEIDTVGMDVTTYGDSGLACGTAYDYRVRAYRSMDSQYSNYSNVDSATTSVCSGFTGTFYEPFDYTDGTGPPTISSYTTGGSVHELDVQSGKLKAVIDTPTFGNYSWVYWKPEGVTFSSTDMVTIEFEGYEKTGYNEGNNYGGFHILSADTSLSDPLIQPGIVIATQNRYSSSILAYGIDDVGARTDFATDMYNAVDGTHDYRLELNHEGGTYQVGALRFYRDGVLEASSEDVSPYLQALNTVRFSFVGDDPVGAMYTWDDLRIRVFDGSVLFEDDFSSEMGWTDESGGAIHRDDVNDWLVWGVRRDTTRRAYIPVYGAPGQFSLTFDFQVTASSGNGDAYFGLVENLSGAQISEAPSAFPTGFFVALKHDTSSGGIDLAHEEIYFPSHEPDTYGGIGDPASYINLAGMSLWYKAALMVDGNDWTLTVYDTSGDIVEQIEGVLPVTHAGYPYLMMFREATSGVETENGLLDNIQVYGHPGTPPPDTPSALVALSISDTEIGLSWTDTSSDETAFHIERSPAGASTWTEIDSTAADVEAYSDTGLTCNTSYDYRVRAYRSGDALFSPYSNVATDQTDACPSTTLFEDDWESGIQTSLWQPYGSPAPTTDAGQGRDGSFGMDPNGDANWDSGLLLKTPFDMSNGVSIEYWMKGDSPPGESYSGLSVGLSTCTPSDNLEQVCHDIPVYIEAGVTSGVVRYQSSGDMYTEPYAPLNGAWHKYRIDIFASGHIAFYRDDVFKHLGPTSLDLLSLGDLRLRIRDRSVNSSYYVDDIVVTSLAGAIVEEFDNPGDFTSTDPDFTISGGTANWTYYRNAGKQYLWRTIPNFSGDVRLLVTGQIDSWTNNCQVRAGIGSALNEIGESPWDVSIAINYGYYGGGCATHGARIGATGATLDYAEAGCVFTGNWLWISPGTPYTAELLIEGGGASLSSPDVNTSVGTPYYTGDYDLLFVGDTGWGDPNSCSGSIERIIVQPLP